MTFTPSKPECLADCFRDGSYLRPIKAPNRLVWSYFNVQGEPPGTLELRKFDACECGCGNLIANPPYGKDQAPSHLFVPPVEESKVEVTSSVEPISLPAHWVIRTLALMVIILMWYSTRP